MEPAKEDEGTDEIEFNSPILMADLFPDPQNDPRVKKMKEAMRHCKSRKSDLFPAEVLPELFVGSLQSATRTVN